MGKTLNMRQSFCSYLALIHHNYYLFVNIDLLPLSSSTILGLRIGICSQLTKLLILMLKMARLYPVLLSELTFLTSDFQK